MSFYLYSLIFWRNCVISMLYLSNFLPERGYHPHTVLNSEIKEVNRHIIYIIIRHCHFIEYVELLPKG